MNITNDLTWATHIHSHDPITPQAVDLSELNLSYVFDDNLNPTPTRNCPRRRPVLAVGSPRHMHWGVSPDQRRPLICISAANTLAFSHFHLFPSPLNSFHTYCPLIRCFTHLPVQVSSFFHPKWNCSVCGCISCCTNVCISMDNGHLLLMSSLRVLLGAIAYGHFVFSLHVSPSPYPHFYLDP